MCIISFTSSRNWYGTACVEIHTRGIYQRLFAHNHIYQYHTKNRIIMMPTLSSRLGSRLCWYQLCCHINAPDDVVLYDHNANVIVTGDRARHQRVPECPGHVDFTAGHTNIANRVPGRARAFFGPGTWLFWPLTLNDDKVGIMAICVVSILHL